MALEPITALSDADASVWRRYYEFEARAHVAGAARRELSEEQRRLNAILASPTPGVIPQDDGWGGFQKPSADEAQRYARVHALARIRRDVLTLEQAALDERAASLLATRDALRNHLTESGVRKYGDEV